MTQPPESLVYCISKPPQSFMHKTAQRDRRHELVIFDPGSHRSLDKLLPDGFVRQISNLFNSELSFLMKLGERELRRELRARGFEPGKRDYVLRVQFWAEYDAAQAVSGPGSMPSINMSKVIKRAIPKEVFYKHYITDPLRLAWLLSPPQEYAEAVEALAQHCIDVLHNFLETVQINKNGFVDIAGVRMVERVYQSCHMKSRYMKGEIRDSQVTANKKKHAAKEVPDEAPPPPPETVEEKKRRLEAERLELAKAKKESGIGIDREPVVE